MTAPLTPQAAQVLRSLLSDLQVSITYNADQIRQQLTAAMVLRPGIDPSSAAAACGTLYPEQSAACVTFYNAIVSAQSSMVAIGQSLALAGANLYPTFDEQAGVRVGDKDSTKTITPTVDGPSSTIGEGGTVTVETYFYDPPL